MKILDLGVLAGDVLVFGGPYSNLQALEALLGEAARRAIPAGRMICTGDVAGYGADPEACIDRVRAAGVAVVAGNVERQLAAGAGDCGCGYAEGSACDRLSAGWYGHADAQVDRAARDWMEALPDMAVFAHEGRRYAVVHGGLTDIARFLWPSTPGDAFGREITAIEAAAGPVDGVIAGHAGLAFERVVSGVHWINAGAIGLPPHDGRAKTRYVILSADGARIKRLSYDHHAAASAMRAAGLVQGYETSLETGIWPSEEVLPPELRR